VSLLLRKTRPVAWVFKKSNRLNGFHRPARDQWLRPAGRKENGATYGDEGIDFDPEERKSRKTHALDAHSSAPGHPDR